MVYSLAIFISLSAICMANSKDVYSAIGIVESGCNDSAIGDGGNAIGRYQIWPCYVKDVNRILGYDAFTLHDRKDPKKSLQMVRIYTSYYGIRYMEKTGRKCTPEVIARIHNGGGANWMNKKSTIKYWNKVKMEMGK